MDSRVFQLAVGQVSSAGYGDRYREQDYQPCSKHQLCEELSTDFEGGKRWMKLNGSRLARYGTTPYVPPENFEE